MTRRELLGDGTLLRTDGSGDVPDTDTYGLFLDDTRHLSRWELTVDGTRPRLLAGADDELVLTPWTRRGADPSCTVFRRQTVRYGRLTERVRIVNHGPDTAELSLSYRFAADFADQFELRTDREYPRPAGLRATEHTDDGTRLTYRRADFHRATTVRVVAGPPADPEDGGVTWTLRLPPHGDLAVTVEVRATDITPPPALTIVVEPTGDAELDEAVARGSADLSTLLVPDDTGGLTVAAGSPWFLTLFGRDSLLTASFALAAAPWLAAGTLRALAATQGRTVDPSRVEEPGKILHERRRGELSHFGHVPYARYYGSVDATPLFLMLLAETGDDALAAELEAPARAAVAWMFDHGGLDRTGWLVYRTDGAGLVHQCWKDSARGICFRSGEPAHGQLAVAEVQAYAYAALRGTAEIADRVWGDRAYADRLDRAAADLRARFVRDFWLDRDDFVALALTEDGRQVDALASNAGHVLWTGLLDDDRAARVGRRLTQSDFFTGWGIRTVAAGQPAYHPVSYHTGGVWPHDTAIAVAGLARHGLHVEAETVARGLLDAAAHHRYRLPEVFAGFGRDEHPVPVPYPHSCSIQAWAAAAPLLLRRVLR
ncbi:Glycogen debranching enzyme (alpha-1,6-glucosidase) [Micromonospora pallida]|uniref:Glycogen debranching enzyme (Alpha-1,6-glucosidase) n=1 Tax=Micromonospora pallida TaxID=145854 RepID=A0A1C6S7P3_9ACTN|nr:glycogen debranching N-terminal domain-containing protein [Micromonospora pallida]SCL25491.1 Glycogen debranching enzyme (alpha-1,6-glucosidase) [Micromonospora pallida]